MNVIVYLLARLVLLCLYAIDAAMLVRAILSWFPAADESRLLDFVYAITEPVILPFRQLFYKLNWFSGVPLDMAFLFANFFLLILTLWLSSGM